MAKNTFTLSEIEEKKLGYIMDKNGILAKAECFREVIDLVYRHVKKTEEGYQRVYERELPNGQKERLVIESRLDKI